MKKLFILLLLTITFSAIFFSAMADVHIKNAILTDYHSGGVEGRNLRIKCYERMSFGKGKLETLENRLKLGFQYTDESFSVANVAPWLVETLEDSNAASV